MGSECAFTDVGRMVRLCLHALVGALVVLSPAAEAKGVVTDRTEVPLRDDARRLLADDFAAVNAGGITLAELGRRVSAHAENARPALRAFLLAGAVRIFARAGETNAQMDAEMRLEALRTPFAVHGERARLHLGRYGWIDFTRCSTGSVEVVREFRGAKSVRVAITRPYWISTYPITRRQAGYWPPWAEQAEGDGVEAYVCPIRLDTDVFTHFLTERFASALPSGYVVRLPTLAEWERAFHADVIEGEGPFADLRRIHVDDEIGKRLYHDYDAAMPVRRQLRNAWGIGDWCPQEKVFDTFDARVLVRSETDPPDSFQVGELPPPKSLVDPVNVCTGAHAVALIRMPSWARWRAVAKSRADDWCPIRLVIAPAISE